VAKQGQATMIDKMAGLINFEAAFQSDVCVIEWPSRMPDSVVQLPRRYAAVFLYCCPMFLLRLSA
jgi:hypothetical protein